MASAFDSAGQRCSALRVLCVQEEAADRLVEMLEGAMAEACIGNPARLAVDVGPVIDAEARDGIERHIAAMRARGHKVYRQGREHGQDTRHGTFVMPTLIELDSISELQREVFGPVLHLVRYRRRDLGALVGQINGTGYGLTLGVHTRIDETIAQIVQHAKAGNVYVNRNIVGAVVGVQPFGGEGLSGTGPKAGGPLYMLRMLSKRPDDAMARAMGGEAASEAVPNAGLSALARWARKTGRDALAAQCARFASLSRAGDSRTLAGPTGERNVYTLLPREAVLCLAGTEADRLAQLAAVLSVGSTAIWPADADTQALSASLPAEVQQSVAIASDWRSPTVAFDAALHHGDDSTLADAMQRIAARPGPIVGVRAFAPGDADIPLESLVVERALSVNTAAAGGNASLMTIG
jgi:RHH-type proline utilization regulon transcriptional repressor/proline dehydrogenase/delta 1-pyrroline-5-carboxylate dehydrogenase